MFPSLDTLVLANNHLHAIEEPDDSLARLFPNLRSISLHKSGKAQAGLLRAERLSSCMERGGSVFPSGSSAVFQGVF